MKLDLKVLIVEDSISFAIELDSLITKIGYTTQKIVDTAEEAFNVITKEIPDLILLDIDLNGKMTGIELSSKIAFLQIPIIFITSSMNEENYLLSKQVNTLAYLSKPISSFSLKAGIETAIKNTFLNNIEKKENSKNEYLFVKKSDVYCKIKTSSILYLKSAGNYCEIFTSEKEVFLLREKISNIIGPFISAKKFIRVHRQYIVKTDQIGSFNNKKNEIVINEISIPISKTYKELILQNLKIVND